MYNGWVFDPLKWGMGSQKLAFSIIIPSLNEERWLPKLLEDLAGQTLPASAFEVLVVDGRSEDATRQQARKFQDRLQLQLLTSQQRNVSVQRNLGADRASGRWVIFMDADNRLPTDFLERVQNRVEGQQSRPQQRQQQRQQQQSPDVFACLITADQPGWREWGLALFINWCLMLFSWIRQPLSPGAMLGVRRQVLEQVRFDPAQLVMEDGLFTKAAVRAGFRFRVLRQPRYVFSFRRYRTEHPLTILVMSFGVVIKYMLGADFSRQHFGYVMNGGGYYQAEAKPDQDVKKT